MQVNVPLSLNYFWFFC